MRRALALACLALLAASGSPPPSVEACAAVGRRGPIPIVGEEALIVWDAERREEHFVRRASFAGASGDFGFLVPTPTRPTLADVDDAVFERLFRIYRRPDPPSRFPTPMGARRSAMGGPGSSVRVIERRVVAGLDAAVLEASDEDALLGWLAANGYPATAALRDWFAPYVRARWRITAFKLDPGGARTARSRAVRMSFRTTEPFFPYSEPPEEDAAPRPFRVSVVAPTRVEAHEGAEPWTARVGYADRPSTLRDALRGAVPEAALAETRWLTVFDDPRSERGPVDLAFAPATHRASVPAQLRRPIALGHERRRRRERLDALDALNDL